MIWKLSFGLICCACYNKFIPDVPFWSICSIYFLTIHCNRYCYYKKLNVNITWALTYHNFHHNSFWQVYCFDMKSFSSHSHLGKFGHRSHRSFVLISHHKNSGTHKLLTLDHCQHTQHKNHTSLNHILGEL